MTGDVFRGNATGQLTHFKRRCEECVTAFEAAVAQQKKDKLLDGALAAVAQERALVVELWKLVDDQARQHCPATNRIATCHQ